MSERGRQFGPERIEMTDPTTGTFIMQLTAEQNASTKLYFEHQSFMANDKTLLFLSQRFPGRGAPCDLYRVDDDASNLTQLTDEKHPLGHPIPAWDENLIYGVRGNALISLEPDSLEETEISRCDDAQGLGACTLSGDGAYFLGCTTLKDGKTAIVRFRTDGSEVVTLCHGMPTNHLVANPGKPEFTFGGKLTEDGPHVVVVSDIDGENVREFPFQGFAHSAWLGRTGRLQGCLLPPGHGIASIASNETEPTTIASGTYFWHSSSSMHIDGDEDRHWIVADTNWPDVGIQLADAESGRYACLCKSLGSQGDWVHPHPSFNRSGTKVLFNSDRTGVPQMYLATIPDHLRDEVLTGNLTHRQRWVGREI